ncbi:phosphotransferase [Demequina sp.]|uniref:phosphotransferase n=1 Tax=Demequina sp. TaxID=2050685 RepID=UPI003D0FC902
MTGTIGTGAPPAEADISAELVAALIEAQFPELAGPLTFLNEGWDNVVYRLGGHHSVRVPRHQMAANISTSELDWLPRVGRNWSFAAPLPVAIGEPGLGYPWRWSIVPWIEGTVALEAPLGPDGAAGLGAALAQVHIPAPDGAPNNEWRGYPLANRAARFDTRVAMLDGRGEFSVDREAALDAVANADPRPFLTWCHLDLHGNNVLSRDGQLAGILDWGTPARAIPRLTWVRPGICSVLSCLTCASLRIGRLVAPPTPPLRACAPRRSSMP